MRIESKTAKITNKRLITFLNPYTFASYWLVQLHFTGMYNIILSQITCAELQKDVLLLEEQEGSVNFKIGVMLMNPGQKTDDEMLSNGKI